MAPRHSPLTLSPVIMNPRQIDTSRPMRSPGATSAAKTTGTPQPTQLLSAAKIQRIDVWRTEISDVVCVCSLRTAPSSIAGPSMPLIIAARSPMIHPPSGPVPLATTASAQSQPQKSPASSVYSSSDVYSSTQATSPLSSNSLGLMLDGKLDLCLQCGVRRNDPSFQNDSEPSLIEGGLSQNEVAGRRSEAPRKQRLWAGVKRLARKCTGRDSHQQTPDAALDTKENDVDEVTFGHIVSRSLSRLSIHGFTTPPLVTAGVVVKEPSQSPPEFPERPDIKNRVSQTFRRMSIHLGSPLQSSAPPNCSTIPLVSPAAPPSYRPSGDGSRYVGASKVAGTQMYSSLRYATTDDERLMEILGTAKIASAGRGRDSPVDIDELAKEDNENPEAKRLRERAERLEKGRRLLTKNGGVATSKRPISFAGVPIVGMGARF